MPDFYDLPSVTVSFGGTVASVTGIVLADLVREDDELVVDGVSARIESLAIATGDGWDLLLKDAWPGESVVGVPGYIRTKPDTVRFTEEVTQFVAMLVQLGLWIPTEGEPDPLIGKDGDVAFDTETLTFYKKVEGEWDLLFRYGYVEDHNPVGEWLVGTTYALKDSVSHEGSSYVSMVESNIGFEPPDNPTKWMLLARGTTVTEVLDELGVHQITISTDDPSGGQDGDLWFKVPV